MGANRLRIRLRRRPRFAAPLALLLAALVLLAASACAPAAQARVRPRFPASVPVAGTVRVTLSLRSVAPGTRLELQQRVGRRWRTRAHARTGRARSAALRLRAPSRPGWLVLRVVAWRGRHAIYRSRTATVQVRARLAAGAAAPVVVAPACPRGQTGTPPDCVPAPPSAYRGAGLAPGDQLTAGQYLVSPDGRFGLTMQSDGNLVEYTADGRPLWASVTEGNPGAYARMQVDGNLVVFGADGSVLWASDTYDNPGARLELQNDASVVVYSPAGAPLWASTDVDRLHPGQALRPRMRLQSRNGQYALEMQTDGNLVEYDRATHPLWASDTNGHPGAYAIMQTDGNLVVMLSGQPLWASGTQSNPGAHLLLQNDGNLVVYSAANVSLWGSGTPGS